MLRRVSALPVLTVLTVVSVVVVAACADDAVDQAATPPAATTSAVVTPTPTPPWTSAPTPRPTPTRTPPAAPAPTREPTGAAEPSRSDARVLAISVDGLNPDALRQLGADGAPHLTRLLDTGLSTLNARTVTEKTVTLPNHVGMVTGRPIAVGLGGHGVTWNDDPPDDTVQAAVGGDVASVFTLVHDAGGSTALFAGKSKFDVMPDSWPGAIDTVVVEERLDRLAERAATELAEQRPTFAFFHADAPDEAGHASGFLSPTYLDAVREADAAVGRLLDVVEADPRLRETTRIVLTADHGGRGRTHGDVTDPANYTVPFLVWGPGVAAGDLYASAPGLQDPGTSQPTYQGEQPVRNCDLANVAARLLRLGEVPGSRCVAAAELATG